MFLNKEQFDALINYIDLMSSQCTGPSIPKVYSELQKLLVEPAQPVVRIDSSGDLHIETEIKEPIPELAYYHEGNFYSVLSNHGMGQAFFNRWLSRSHEFPKSQQEAQQRKAQDYRVVPRGLLEHCLDTFETWKFLPTSDSGKQLRKNIDIAIAQLKASLAIEKKELKSPFVQVHTPPKTWTCGFCGASSENSEAEIPHKWTCPNK